MIIPIKCFTCGMVLADKYRYYQNEIRRQKLLQGVSADKDIGLNKVCCRRHMLTHVDIE